MSRRWTLPVVVAAVLCCVPASARAEAPAADAGRTGTAMSAEQRKLLELWIAQLGADEFQKREEASTAIRAMGKAILIPLKQSLEKSTEPEIKARLAALVAEYEKLERLFVKATDPDSGRLSFRWRQVDGPPVSIANPTACVRDDETNTWISDTSFVPSGPGRYVFEIVVTNEAGQENSRSVTRVVAAADDAARQRR